MSVAAASIGASDPRGFPFRARVATLLVAGVLADGVATGIALLGTPLATPLETAFAVGAHGIAVCLLSLALRGRPSRRWLSVAALAAVPLLGAAMVPALLAEGGRGRALAVQSRRLRRRRPPMLVVGPGLGGALSLCDALQRGDAEQRQAALWTLSRRRDPEAIALLRRAAADGDPDLALAAALVLDELGERDESEPGRAEPREARDGSG